MLSFIDALLRVPLTSDRTGSGPGHGHQHTGNLIVGRSALSPRRAGPTPSPSPPVGVPGPAARATVSECQMVRRQPLLQQDGGWWSVLGPIQVARTPSLSQASYSDFESVSPFYLNDIESSTHELHGSNCGPGSPGILVVIRAEATEAPHWQPA
jgi:hypothetical protein